MYNTLNDRVYTQRGIRCVNHTVTGSSALEFSTVPSSHQQVRTMITKFGDGEIEAVCQQKTGRSSDYLRELQKPRATAPEVVH